MPENKPFEHRQCRKTRDGRCTICNSLFESCGEHCLQGHELGADYRVYFGPGQLPLPVMVHLRKCGVYYGNRCTICGQMFADGDDICAHGHMIGQLYEVRPDQTARSA